jgi:signal peptidase
VRVYEFARELDLPSRELLSRLHELGFTQVTTASSNVPADAVAGLRGPVLEPSATEEPAAGPRVPETGSSTTEEVEEHSDERAPDAGTNERAGTRSLGRWAATLVLWTVFGLGAGFVLAITLPIVQGNRSLTVLSGSMEPAIGTGDVVVVEQIRPLDARIGDIVSFRDPDDPSRLITHRVRAMEVDGTEIEFVTKGDANTSVEQWRITPDGQIGRVVFRVPTIGYVLYYLRSSIGRLLLIVVPALLLGAYELWRIWRPTPPSGGTDEDATHPETTADPATEAAR